MSRKSSGRDVAGRNAVSEMLLIVPRGAHGLELLDGVVQTLNPGKTFGFGFGHAPIEIGVVAACLSGGLESVEEEVVLSGRETAGGTHAWTIRARGGGR